MMQSTEQQPVRADLVQQRVREKKKKKKSIGAEVRRLQKSFCLPAI